jgi:hypothetical protein
MTESYGFAIGQSKSMEIAMEEFEPNSISPQTGDEPVFFNEPKATGYQANEQRGPIFKSYRRTMALYRRGIRDL